MHFHQHKLMTFVTKYRMFWLTAVILLFWFIDKTFISTCNSHINDKIVCTDSFENENSTGLEMVEILSKLAPLSLKSKCIPFPLIEQIPSFNAKEKEEIQKCILTSEKANRRAHSLFWSGDNQKIRIKHHVYLDHKSTVLDVGGNVGDDALNFLQTYGPQSYIILEPMKYLYHKLQEKFKDNKNVTIYNIGLSKTNARFYVDMKGFEGDATSVFQSSGAIGSCLLKTVNASEFYLKIGIGCFEIDLVTINCEGCEFDVLENMLSTGTVKYFRHIQFATHTKLTYVQSAELRYCRIQALLKRTHAISYQYKFNWETWTRKE